MNPKIMKLRGELEKNKGKISDLQGRNCTGHFGKGGVEP